MKKYAVIQLNRDGSHDLLEVIEENNIKDARVAATRNHMNIVADFMNHKLMVVGYKTYKDEMSRRTS